MCFLQVGNGELRVALERVEVLVAQQLLHESPCAVRRNDYALAGEVHRE